MNILKLTDKPVELQAVKDKVLEELQYLRSLDTAGDGGHSLFSHCFTDACKQHGYGPEYQVQMLSRSFYTYSTQQAIVRACSANSNTGESAHETGHDPKTLRSLSSRFIIWS